MWSQNGEECFPVGRGYHPPWETSHKTASEGPEGAPHGHAPRSLVPKGQTPHADMSKSCSLEAVYRCMRPSCIRTILAIPIRKTMSTVQGIRPCCSYLHELFLEIKYTILLWHIPRYKKSQLIFNVYTPTPSFNTSVTSLTKRWTQFLK